MHNSPRHLQHSPAGCISSCNQTIVSGNPCHNRARGLSANHPATCNAKIACAGQQNSMLIRERKHKHCLWSTSGSLLCPGIAQLETAVQRLATSRKSSRFSGAHVFFDFCADCRLLVGCFSMWESQLLVDNRTSQEISENRVLQLVPL